MRSEDKRYFINHLRRRIQRENGAKTAFEAMVATMGSISDIRRTIVLLASYGVEECEPGPEELKSKEERIYLLQRLRRLIVGLPEGSRRADQDLLSEVQIED